MSALRWKCVKCALRISLDCERPFRLQRGVVPLSSVPKASWTTCIESRTGIMSQLTMTWFVRVYEQWACRSIVSCLRQVRIILCLCELGLLTSGQGREAGYEWIFYDVGGSRTHVSPYCGYLITADSSLQRGSWHPYFMDVKAIIFLAPISVFDERAEGEGGLNRLEDSIKFWTAICKSKLLAKVTKPFASCATNGTY